MNPQIIIDALERNKTVFQNLLQGIGKDQYLWKPAPDKWCLLEVIGHLLDEELLDFKPRITFTLKEQKGPLPKSVDPVGWAAGNNYLKKDYEETLKQFLVEREKSISWLKSLQSPSWSNYWEHPKYGPLTAGMFLCNWPAHDYLHIRQITRLQYQYLTNNYKESFLYAGEW